MARTPRDRNGYTLIELLTVVTIIGILAAMATPVLDTSRLQAEAAAQSLGTTLLNAQRTAVSRQHAVVVAFDVANHRIRIHQDANNNGVIDSRETVTFHSLEPPVRFGRGAAPARPIGANAVSFTRRQGDLAALTFYRNGSASEEGVFYLTARPDRANHTRAIEIDRGTGRISWLRYRSNAWTRDF